LGRLTSFGGKRNERREERSEWRERIERREDREERGHLFAVHGIEVLISQRGSGFRVQGLALGSGFRV
jgi:hypothetical protein